MQCRAPKTPEGPTCEGGGNTRGVCVSKCCPMHDSWFEAAIVYVGWSGTSRDEQSADITPPHNRLLKPWRLRSGFHQEGLHKGLEEVHITKLSCLSPLAYRSLCTSPHTHKTARERTHTHTYALQEIIWIASGTLAQQSIHPSSTTSPVERALCPQHVRVDTSACLYLPSPPSLTTHTPPRPARATSLK
jgi:hypothetical protein